MMRRYTVTITATVEIDDDAPHYSPHDIALCMGVANTYDTDIVPVLGDEHFKVIDYIEQEAQEVER